MAPPVSSVDRVLDENWVQRHRVKALEGLKKLGRQGFMEVVFFSPNAVINQPQDALLKARQKMRPFARSDGQSA